MRKVSDIREYKSALRAKYKEKRMNLSSEEKQQLDSSILRRVVSSRTYKECETLLTFVSTAIEVDTHKLIQTALQDGKTVAVPRCVSGTREMEFFRISSMEDLESGTFGVLEPVPERCEKIAEFPKPMCIVPGLAFDLAGYRLGYGKGYYDRFLSAHPELVNVGVCYCCCTLNRLIHGRFDVAVNYLITEKYMKAF